MSKERSKLRVICVGALGLAPLLMGGCPDVRNGIIDAIQTATSAAVAESVDRGAGGVLVRELADALTDALLDRFRDGPTP